MLNVAVPIKENSPDSSVALYGLLRGLLERRELEGSGSLEGRSGRVPGGQCAGPGGQGDTGRLGLGSGRMSELEIMTRRDA